MCDHDAVADWQDARQVVLIRRNHLVVLLDRLGPNGPIIVLGRVLSDAPGPQNVVANVEASRSNAVAGRTPCIWVAVLVDVVVDDVKLAGGLVQSRHRI